MNLYTRFQTKSLLCSIKRSRGDTGLVDNDFDAVLADEGRQIIFAMHGQRVDIDVSKLKNQSFATAFEALMTLKDKTTDGFLFGRTRTVGIITHEAMLPLAALVDVAIRVEGIGQRLDDRPQDIWLNAGTTWADVFKAATEEEIDFSDE